MEEGCHFGVRGHDRAFELDDMSSSSKAVTWHRTPRSGAAQVDWQVNQPGLKGSAVPSGLGGLLGCKPHDESRGYYRSSRWDFAGVVGLQFPQSRGDGQTGGAEGGEEAANQADNQ